MKQWKQLVLKNKTYTLEFIPHQDLTFECSLEREWTESAQSLLSASAMTSPSSVAARSFWKLGGQSAWRLGRTVFEQIIANNVFGRAAELAFYFLFALFPLFFFYDDVVWPVRLAERGTSK